MKTPVLESERLLLRPLTVDDAERVFMWTGDPRVAECMIWDIHKTVEDTRQWLLDETSNIDSDKDYTWGVVLKENGELVGSCALMKFDKTCFETGCNFIYDFWGRGYGTEATRTILEFGKKELRQRRFFARHAVDNDRAKRVLEKLNFEFSNYNVCYTLGERKRFEVKEYYLHVTE